MGNKLKFQNISDYWILFCSIILFYYSVLLREYEAVRKQKQTTTAATGFIPHRSPNRHNQPEAKTSQVTITGGGEKHPWTNAPVARKKDSGVLAGRGGGDSSLSQQSVSKRSKIKWWQESTPNDDRMVILSLYDADVWSDYSSRLADAQDWFRDYFCKFVKI